MKKLISKQEIEFKIYMKECILPFKNIKNKVELERYIKSSKYYADHVAISIISSYFKVIFYVYNEEKDNVIKICEFDDTH